MKRNSIIKILALFIVSLLITSLSFSQGVKDKPFKDRLFGGGYLGLQFGSYSTMIDVSPIIGYSLTDNIDVGIGPTYKFYKYKNFYYVTLANGETRYYDHKANMLGASVFGRYYFNSEYIPFLNSLFAHVEYEYLNYYYDYYFSNADGTDVNTSQLSYDISSFFVGGGLKQMMGGGRSFFYLLVLWNLNETYESPYSNPVIRMGVNVGF